ncbi:hypothetical protein CC2G_002877 [Coprinopsis cinerea AmutBmut pab1-1]|nr:hypothetical protein CC2G_002877 [Coprinopsis cinerea AmutBmut pab1-1]
MRATHSLSILFGSLASQRRQPHTWNTKYFPAKYTGPQLGDHRTPSVSASTRGPGFPPPLTLRRCSVNGENYIALHGTTVASRLAGWHEDSLPSTRSSSASFGTVHQLLTALVNS